MTQITNAPDAQQPFVDKRGFITRAWFQWLLNIISNATTGGTVTHTGTLTAPKLIQGNGGADITVNTTTATVTKLTAGVPSAATAGTDYTALAFKTIAVSGQSDIVADSAADLLTVAAGSGVTLTTNAGTDTLTIAATGTGGTVTNTGTLTSGKLIQGNGGVDVTANATTATVTKLTAGTPSAASAGTDYVAPGAITSDGITMSTARLLGRTTAATGAVEEITAGTGLTLSAGTLTATGSGGTVTTTGSPASGNLTKFSGASSITNADLTGDLTTSGTVATTLATVNANVGTFGDGTHVAQVTANAKGLITGVSSVAITNQGTVTTTGSPASGNLTKFSGATSVTNADLTGDVTTAGTVATTLANSGASAGTYGSATLAPVVTVDVKGRVTSITTATITPGAGSGGAFTLIQQIITSGSQATVDFTSIPAYTTLKLLYTTRDTKAGAGGAGLYLTINNDTTNANYTNTVRGGTNATTTITSQVAPAGGGYIGDHPTDGSTAGMAAYGEITIPNYAQTTFYKGVIASNQYDFSTLVLQQLYFRWTNTAAITRLTITPGVAGSAFKNGSEWTLYGLL